MRPSAQAGAHPVFFSIWERKACDTQEAFLTHLVYAVSHRLGTETSVPSSPEVSVEQSLEDQSGSPSTRFHWPPAHYGLASSPPPRPPLPSMQLSESRNARKPSSAPGTNLQEKGGPRHQEQGLEGLGGYKLVIWT